MNKILSWNKIASQQLQFEQLEMRLFSIGSLLKKSGKNYRIVVKRELPWKLQKKKSQTE